MTRRTGSCLCGEVSYSIPDDNLTVLHCHCENCRRLTGNFVAAARTPTADLAIADNTSLRWHDVDYARYGFCVSCGSTMFFRARERQETTSVMIGTFDQADDVPLESVWFAGDALPHVKVGPDIPHFDGNG